MWSAVDVYYIGIIGIRSLVESGISPRYGKHERSGESYCRVASYVRHPEVEVVSKTGIRNLEDDWILL
jgi:hypothetical protein